MNIYQYPPVQKGENKVEYIKDFLRRLIYATKRRRSLFNGGSNKYGG
jgi:hypothetical protein